MSALPVTKILRREAYISLATFRRNGTAVETPVWFAIQNDTLYVVTDGTSGKVKRIRATKKVRVAPCNVWGRVTGDWSDGTGRIIKDTDLIERAHAALSEKYGWQMWLLDTTSRLFGRIGRRAYLELSVDAALRETATGSGNSYRKRQHPRHNDSVPAPPRRLR